MRIITKHEQNTINGGVGTPPGSIVFAGVIIVLGAMPILVGSSTSNISTYVNGINDFFKNLTKNTA